MSDVVKTLVLLGAGGVAASAFGFVDFSGVDLNHLSNFNINSIKIKGMDQAMNDMREAYRYFETHGLSEAKRIFESVKNAQK